MHIPKSVLLWTLRVPCHTILAQLQVPFFSRHKPKIPLICLSAHWTSVAVFSCSWVDSWFGLGFFFPFQAPYILQNYPSVGPTLNVTHNQKRFKRFPADFLFLGFLWNTALPAVILVEWHKTDFSWLSLSYITRLWKQMNTCLAIQTVTNSIDYINISRTFS